MSASSSSTSAITALLIDKSGSIKEISIKLADFPNLYKKAGFNSAEHFQEHHTWEITMEQVKYSINLMGKKKGKNAKNAYSFPPPFEQVSDFIGNVVLLNHKGQQNLTIAEWNRIYDILSEQALGEDDLDDDDDGMEDVEENYEASDNEDDEEDDDGDEEDETEREDRWTSTHKSKKRSKSHASSSILNDFVVGFSSGAYEADLLDCSAELQPEEYV